MGDKGIDGHTLEVATLYAGRVAGYAAELETAHELGARPGGHHKPWSIEYQREAVPIYLSTMSITYLRDLAANFSRAADVLERWAPGPSGAWGIVATYLRSSDQAINEHPSPAPRSPEPGDILSIAPSTPSAMRFDLLATLVSAEGAARLRRAGNEVVYDVETSARPELTVSQRALLIEIGAGATAAELAEAHGWSERTIYREMSRIWAALGASNRVEGLLRAKDLGLLT